MAPTLKPQEVPYDSPDSINFFNPSTAGKPFLATPSALNMYREEIEACLARLQHLAQVHDGADYLAVFENNDGDDLWLIEDGQAVTALLPSDY